MRSRGVARILERGFPWVVILDAGVWGLSPDADDLLYTMRRKIMIFDCIYIHW